MQKCIVNNLKQTMSLAKRFSKTLKGGEVVLFDAEMGAGKTTFTKFLFKCLGVREIVSSPTFTLLREYQTKKFCLYHFDMYRIEDYNEIGEIGFFEYLNKPNAIVVIEWFEKIKEALSGEFIKITINKTSETGREFQFEKVKL